MKLLKLVVLSAFLALVVSGCKEDYRSNFLQQAAEKQWKKEQQLTALYWSYRLLFFKKGEDGSLAVVYSRLPKEEVVFQLEKNLADLREILDYRNAEMNKFVKTFGLRPYLLRQEFILKAVLARVLADENNKRFKEFLGEVNMSAAALGYDERVLTIVDLSKTYPFTSKVVEEARAAGVLKEVGRTVREDSRDMYQKEQDPNDPNDPNKFVWVSKKVAYELVQYKIMVQDEVSRDNKPNYVEIWRLVDGKRESMPALKAFLDGSGSAVIVLDSDKESEKIGFGLPNIVERVPEDSLYGDQMIARLFPDRKKGAVEPKSPPIRVEIVHAGATSDGWEKCTGTEGCRVPASYRREPMKDNYSVRAYLKVEKKKDAMETAVAVEHFAKEWTDGKYEYSWSPGKVVEYYRPKALCTGSSLLSAQVLYMESKKKVRIVCKDGTETDRIVTSTPNVVIEDKPYQMAFTIGETRWLVWDSNGDGVFDKRRKISPVLKNTVGVYQSGAEITAGDGSVITAPSEPVPGMW